MGYSTIPTDTVLILDMSRSMRTNDSRNGSAIDELVDATNKAITDLQELNKNNRVAVVLYSGNTAASFSSGDGATVTVLPLDTYIPASTSGGVGVYLQSIPYTNTGVERQYRGTANWAVQVARGVKNSSGAAVSGVKNTEAGTYTQDGIYEAMKVLLAVDKEDTRVGSGVQAGTDRIPIMVLMTDGEPTLANNDYNGNDARTELGNSVMYNYDQSNHRDTIAFMTQLTAAFAKKQVSSHYYHGDTLFYTLSYGDQVTERPESLSVMNPVRNSAAINTLWNTFLADRSVTVYTSGNTRLSVRNSTNQAERLSAADKIYVDEYFPADTDEEFFAAFDAIVKEIEIQSRYYPTYVEDDHDHDGYITFTDKIGGYMTVKKMVGLVIGNHYFSGETLARNFTKTANTTTAPILEAETVSSVQQRLGIANEQIARDLLIKAYEKDQLVYYRNTGRFSNYIGWYSDADGNYLDFWYEGIQTAVPAGATHIVKSYGFLGETDAVHGIRSTDMLYASVRVAKEIGDQDGDNIIGETLLTWRLPASLIPTITYQVAVEVDGEGTITRVMDVDLESDTVKPIRLLYEVALNEDIADWNVTEKMHSAYRDSTANKAAGYVVYTNQWKKSVGDNTHLTDTTRNTYSHFEPSVRNERYYYTENTPVYTAEDANALYTGDKNSPPNPKGTYYWAYNVYERMKNGTYRIHVHYERISEAALNVAGYINNRWVIPKDTVHRYLDDFRVSKKVPQTGTSDYVNYPEVVHNDNPDTYYSYSVLGNNGRLTLTPATGIRVTKSLPQTVDGAATTFRFAISGGTGSGTLVRLREDGSEASRTTLRFADGFTLEAGETVYILDLEDGVDYTVRELQSATGAYVLTGLTVNGQAVSGDTARITARSQAVQTADFVNTPRGYGNLFITKELAGNYEIPTAVHNEAFTVKVFVGTHLANEEFDVLTAGATYDGKVKADGYLYVNDAHLQITPNQTYEVVGLPEGTQVTVTEELTATQSKYFTASVLTRDHTNALQDSDNVVIIPHSLRATANLINTYKPAEADPVTVNVAGTKNFDIVAYGQNVTFEFQVQKHDGTGWQPIATEDVSYFAGDTATQKTFAISSVLDGEVFREPGEYAYRIVEKPGDASTGITFDTSIHTFTVTVQDNGAGKLVATVSGHHDGAVTESGGVWTVNPVFTNTYHTAEVHLDADKAVEDRSGSIPGAGHAGFHLSIYKATKNGTVLTPVGNALDTEVTDSLGDARFSLVYNKADAGTHHYVVREEAPATVPAGWNYDATLYYVTVEVEENGGVISAAVTELKRVEGTDQTALAADATLTFKNVYDPVDTKVDLNVDLDVNKVLEDGTLDRPLQANEFTFYVVENGADYRDPATTILATGKNTAAGDVVFDKPLPFDKVGHFAYDIVEEHPDRPAGGVTYDPTVFDLAVEVEDVNGQLTATAIFEDSIDETVTFRNSYTTTDTTLTITGSKKLTGRALLNAEFAFTLTQVTDGTGSTVLQDGLTLTAENGPDDNHDGVATLAFPAITYTAADAGKTYFYRITEKHAGDTIDGITFSNATYVVTVTVRDNLDGTLTATAQGADAILFENVYSAAAAVVDLHGYKTLEGKSLAADEFTFKLTPADAAYEPLAGAIATVAANDENGNVYFNDLTFPAAGDYYYVITEKVGSDVRVTYDATAYHVHVQVEDTLGGQLEASVEMFMVSADDQQAEQPTSTFNFHNVYTPKPEDLQVKVVIDKTVISDDDAISPAGFEFTVLEEGLVGHYLVITEEDGKGILDLTYTDSDIGKTYTYTVTENDTGMEGMRYSDAEYVVKVTVGLDGDNKLTADVTVNGEPVEEAVLAFENIYESTPDGGEDDDDKTPAPDEEDGDKKPAPDGDDDNGGEIPAPDEDGDEDKTPAPDSKPEKAPQDDKPTDNGENESPKTGDSTQLPLWFALLFVSGGGILGTILGKRKTEDE